MYNEGLLESLKAAKSSEQKAALVAKALISDLPENIAEVAIKCSFMHWFSEDIIEALLGDSSDTTQIRLITDLPFVEKLAWGYCFHSTTRTGLINEFFLVAQNLFTQLIT
jgi:hypothetical protein